MTRMNYLNFPHDQFYQNVNPKKKKNDFFFVATGINICFHISGLTFILKKPSNLENGKTTFLNSVAEIHSFTCIFPLKIKIMDVVLFFPCQKMLILIHF